jgi:lysophospholipase L1-like esterase
MAAQWLRLAALILALVLVAAPGRAQGIAVKDGQKIAFLGDSITEFGVHWPSGYVRLVISGLEANGIKAIAIPAGISGNKSNDMLGRLQRDVIDKKPDWMTLSCGVNDVWHGQGGVPLDQYKRNITAIVQQAQAAGVKVMILTSTMIGEEAGNANNQKLVAYNDFLRSLAAEKKCLLADLSGDMQAAVKEAGGGAGSKKGNVLTVDGVHMLPQGNRVMASGILKQFGLSPQQLQTAQTAWLDIPKACDLAGHATVTMRRYDQLSALAQQKNVSLNDLINAAYDQALVQLLQTPAPNSAGAK